MTFSIDPAQLRAVLEALARFTEQVKRLNDTLEDGKRERGAGL